MRTILQAIAIGDSIGLPWEGLPPQPTKTNWEQSFLFGWGITSDDAQNASLTLQAIQNSDGNLETFRKLIGRYLAQWFLCLPPGIGLATLRSCGKLCLGLRAPKSGVWSAGNGPAMRAPIIGWELWDSPHLEEYVRISTQTTHTDPKALHVSLALARTIARLRQDPTATYETILPLWQQIQDPAWLQLLSSVEKSKTIEEFLLLTKQKKGISGYIYHTGIAALWVWKIHRHNFEDAIKTSLQLGGDTDSLAGVVAALSVASGGTPPKPWEKVLDLPKGKPSDFTGPKRIGWNIISILAIFIIHIPKRIFQVILRTI